MSDTPTGTEVSCQSRSRTHARNPRGHTHGATLADRGATHRHVDPQTSLLLWHFLGTLGGLHQRASHLRTAHEHRAGARRRARVHERLVKVNKDATFARPSSNFRSLTTLLPPPGSGLGLGRQGTRRQCLQVL